MRNHTITWNKDKVHEEDIMVEETLLEEEAEEEKGAITVEIKGTCLGNVPRKRKKEEKLISQKRSEEMLRQKGQRMEHP
jgi:hypothetical protein